MSARIALGTLLWAASSAGQCPMEGALPAGHPPARRMLSHPAKRRLFEESVKELDFGSVKKDLVAFFTDSKEFWPADYGNYAPFMIRFTWHHAGTYRSSDGVGGLEGAHQRFDPSRSWQDNANLDKARALLGPLKLKYGSALSWGDLFTLAGTVAIESMGGPPLGFCGGRVDDDDGGESVRLGPTPEQERFHSCPVNGNCTWPLGATMVGLDKSLIYVNPEGHMGKPDIEGSIHAIRWTFGAMGMNDSETVALIGAHTVGKCHGACPAGAGKLPRDDEEHAWEGNCGSGKLADAFSSGIEGPWTTTPTNWDNEYFHLLLNTNYTVEKGPGGAWQWKPTGPTELADPNTWTRPQAPAVNDSSAKQTTMMMTTDVALVHDPSYLHWVKVYADDQATFDRAFAAAWYKLVTRDMGPPERCVGSSVPPPQPFQFPLPPSPPKQKLANFTKVFEELLEEENDRLLAFQCAATYRATDHQGGCNGARIRFDPEEKTMRPTQRSALANLTAIKKRYGDGLSWADLIVLSGYAAMLQAGGKPMAFCGGRTDASDGAGSANVINESETYFSGHMARSPYYFKEHLSGLSTSEMVALFVAVRADRPFGDYLRSTYTAKNATVDEKMLWFDPEVSAKTFELASDDEMLLEAIAAAWTKLMNIDRFAGPVSNACDDPEATVMLGSNLQSSKITSEKEPSDAATAASGAALVLIAGFALATTIVAATFSNRPWRQSGEKPHYSPQL